MQHFELARQAVADVHFDTALVCVGFGFSRARSPSRLGARSRIAFCTRASQFAPSFEACRLARCRALGQLVQHMQLRLRLPAPLARAADGRLPDSRGRCASSAAPAPPLTMSNQNPGTDSSRRGARRSSATARAATRYAAAAWSASAKTLSVPANGAHDVIEIELRRNARKR